jgi:electron transfer flavoprotein beta subunit
MHIIVPIKQVPDIKKVKMDKETGTIIRKGVDSVINPLDLYAIEAALELKDRKIADKIIIITMGPPSAKYALKEAIAMGADDAYLLSDKAFAGSDTLATSLVLGAAIKKIGKFDLIICGERAIDGDTSQVGPELAAFLDLPVATYISNLSIQNKYCKLKRRIEEGIENLTVNLPALLTVVKEINYPRLPTYRGKKKAKNTEIPIWQLADINLPKEKVGLKGSPTKVVKIFTPNVKRKCKMIFIKNETDINNAAINFTNFLMDNKYL